MRAGNTTLLIGGVEAGGQVNTVLDLVKRTCKRREQVDPIPLIPFARGGKVDSRVEHVMIGGGANIFSVDVERFEKKFESIQIGIAPRTIDFQKGKSRDASVEPVLQNFAGRTG